MKTPAAPPDFLALFSEVVRSDRADQVIAASSTGSMSQEYLPWDKVRFKDPPDGLSLDEWWVAIKIGRRAMQREIPALRNMEGQPFRYALPDTVLRDCDLITQQASGSIAVSEQITNHDTRDRYVVNSLIEEAIRSSQLEGAATSRRDAKAMIRSGRPPRDRSETMILNNLAAMQRITEIRDEPLTPKLVCEIHRIVTEGTLDNPAAAGALQDNDDTRVSVWGDQDQLLHRPPPVAELGPRLEALCGFANGRDDSGYMPPVLRAITIHFMVGYDHYFEDGNGRTARALFYWSLLHQGYWLAEFLSISTILRGAPTQYVRSFLLTEDDEGDLTHFFIHHLRVIRRAIDELHRYLARKADEVRAVQHQIRSMPGEYNHRQLALLEHAITHPSDIYTAKSHGSSHRVSIPTARADLVELERKGLLTRFKVSKQFAWRPATRLSEHVAHTTSPD